MYKLKMPTLLFRYTYYILVPSEFYTQFNKI